MPLKRGVKWLIHLTLALVLSVTLPGTAVAHNVTFTAEVTLDASGRPVEVYIYDVIRNPVADAAVTVRTGSGTAALTEQEPGNYTGELPSAVQPGERLRLEVAVGENNVWSGSSQAVLGDTTRALLTHQHGIDGRTFSIVMTWVFGSLLGIIAIYECWRLWRRRRVQVSN